MLHRTYLMITVPNTVHIMYGPCTVYTVHQAIILYGPRHIFQCSKRRHLEIDPVFNSLLLNPPTLKTQTSLV